MPSRWIAGSRADSVRSSASPASTVCWALCTHSFTRSCSRSCFLRLGGLVVTVVVSWRQRDVVAAAFVVFAGMVLFSATVYPWYLIWVLPWAAALGRWPWLVLSSVACFVYVPELLGIPLMPWPFLLMWTPFVVALNLERRTG